jgi:phosphoribosylamine--glycine ligase
VRFGDPETQVLVPRFDFDLVELYRALAERRLKDFETKLAPRSAVCVVLASGGYPEHYEKGFFIEGLEKLADPNVLVFHAGTALKDNRVITAGGRVLNVVGLGASVAEARQRAYAALAQISFPKMHYRRDIAA